MFMQIYIKIFFYQNINIKKYVGEDPWFAGLRRLRQMKKARNRIKFVLCIIMF